MNPEIPRLLHTSFFEYTYSLISILKNGKPRISAAEDARYVLPTPGGPANKYVVQVVFPGNSVYLPAFSSTVFNVNRLDTIITVDAKFSRVATDYYAGERGALFYATLKDSDGKVWSTKEPAIMFFFRDRWFNIIGQLKDYGIYFYCNIATPFLIDEGVIKYIDYDLDLRVFPNGSFKILDRMEYKFHKKQMHYSNRLDFILRYELGSLIDIVRKKDFPFDKDTIEKYYEKYVELTKKQDH